MNNKLRELYLVQSFDVSLCPKTNVTVFTIKTGNVLNNRDAMLIQADCGFLPEQYGYKPFGSGIDNDGYFHYRWGCKSAVIQ